MSEQENSILIVGGGWAGLSCAVELTRLGHRVSVYESARQCGGRARRVTHNHLNIDNGQHILLGAYTHTLNILDTLGVRSEELLLRLPMQLQLHEYNQRPVKLNAPVIPAPLHLLVGLLRMQGMSWTDRLRAIRLGARLWLRRISLKDDISVATWLHTEKQSDRLIKCIWEPLCIASLNTPIDIASAQVFIQVLHDALCTSHTASDLLLAKTDLGVLLPDPATRYVQSHGNYVQVSTRVDELIIENNTVRGIICQDHMIAANHVVLAVPPHAAIPLTQSHNVLQSLAKQLESFHYEPICTVYLQYPHTFQTDFVMQGMLGTTAQWVVDRRICNQPGLIAVVISSQGPHLQWDHATLAQHLMQEFKQIFPHWPEPTLLQIICEKRATFSCRVGINRIRPDNSTPVNGLWLAGDFTQTKYPATIEGAVMSGVQCARKIHQCKNITTAS